MALYRKKVGSRKRKLGMAPGSLIYLGPQPDAPPKVSVFDYSSGHFEERPIDTPEDCFTYREKDSVTWINIDGLHDTELIRKIGEHFGVHSLSLEDVLNISHRPKLDDMDDYLFIIAKMLYAKPNSSLFVIEHICIIVGSNFVISFQESGGDVFDRVRERIRLGKGRTRHLGADYLAYILLDMIVDHYFTYLEYVDGRIEELDRRIVNRVKGNALLDIHQLKSDVVTVRRVVQPLREIVHQLKKGDSPLIHESTSIFIDDLSDHVLYLNESVESYRDILGGMADFYISSENYRLNETVQVLTIMASIFIPLTFIASIYGMNFHYMPELSWPHGYAYVLTGMAAVAGIMLLYFRGKKWI